MEVDEDIVNAMELLDVMTCSSDQEDPQYDVEKDIKRDEILFNNDYEELKLELRRRGLRTNGDKPEMIIRLLLNIIDPSVKYSTLSGVEKTLSYVNEDDISSGEVVMLDLAERAHTLHSVPDADDVKALGQRRPNARVRGLQSAGTSGKGDRKLVMDGLTRREVTFPSMEVTRSSSLRASQDDGGRNVRAYISGGRDVLRSWERRSTVVVVLPDERGWRDSGVRVFADEIAFSNQVIVMVPDIHSGAALTGGASDGDVAKWRERISTGPLSARLIDDVVATLDFAREDYGAVAFGVAGVGDGAGRALEVCAFFGRVQDAMEESTLTSVPTAQSLTGRDGHAKMGDDDDAGNGADVRDETFRQEVVEARRLGALVASGLMSDGTHLSPQSLMRLAPRACFAVTPEPFPIEAVVGACRCAPFIVLGEKDDNGQSETLLAALTARHDAVPDFSIRVYEERGGGDHRHFVHHTREDDEDEVKAAQEAQAIGCIWLDIFTRDERDDLTSGVGETKALAESALVRVSTSDLINPVRSSAVAAYLHDDADFVKDLAAQIQGFGQDGTIVDSHQG